MQFAIITGESRGLGNAIARLLLEQEINVIGISRNGNDELKTIAKSHQVKYKHYYCDLANTTMLEKTASIISEYLFKNDASKIYLINNAGVLQPIDQAMNIRAEDLSYHVQVNTIAPIILLNLFLRKATNHQVPLIGVTVTSGAAERPIYGWSVYCSTKASINMYTKTAALEQEEKNTCHKVIAFNPGIMDTKMQEQIRASTADEFIQVEDFRLLKENNQLRDTKTVGQVLVNILMHEETIINGKIYSVGEYL